MDKKSGRRRLSWSRGLPQILLLRGTQLPEGSTGGYVVVFDDDPSGGGPAQRRESDGPPPGAAGSGRSPRYSFRQNACGWKLADKLHGADTDMLNRRHRRSSTRSRP